MTIGRFAHASGLTIKALRFYDEKGLLEPRSVDQDTGYRRYSAGQLRRAAMIKVLRQMGMSLAQVREVVDNPDRAAEHLARFKGDLDIQRARQDSAMERGMDTLRSYDRPVQVQARVAPAQQWVGAVLPVDLTTVDPAKGAQDFEAAFVRLVEALQESDNPPVASFWTTIRADDTGTGGDLVLCWPVAKPVDGTFSIEGLRLEHGTLPERRESFVRLDFASDQYPSEAASDAAPHPAFLALMEQLEQCGDDTELIRQVGVPGPDGRPEGIEIAVTTAVVGPTVTAAG